MTSINPLSSTPPAAAASTPSTGADSLSDPNTFLKLLVAELKYQNPMNPADPNQYLAQTAQFTMVQKLDDIDKQVAAALNASQQATAASYLGRQIVGTTANGANVTGTVDGFQPSSNGPLLMVGNQAVPMGNVTSVSVPPSTSASTTSTTKPA